MQTALREIKITVPWEILLSLSMTEEQLAQEFCHSLAFQGFAEGRLSTGTAAKLAGISKMAFVLECGQRGIDILPYSKDELSRELVEE
jgi:predicted HTH domain antitoxin